MSQTPTIECKPNGPYVVKGLEGFEKALCRCGGSATKPFCDGTHRKNGFAAPGAGGTAGKRDDYHGRKITVHDNRAICAHAGHCTDGLAAVFKNGAEPWIAPDGAAAETIIQAVRSCPSGALSYSTDGVEQRDPSRPAGITVTKDGPYAVVGGVELNGQRWAEGASSEHYTLCRCGGSKNKPFCDGSHWNIGFKDP